MPLPIQIVFQTEKQKTGLLTLVHELKLKGRNRKFKTGVVLTLVHIGTDAHTNIYIVSDGLLRLD